MPSGVWTISKKTSLQKVKEEINNMIITSVFSCGHVFCHKHSSNQMALFFSKNGQERGEWCRVCDGCLYERMNPYLTLS